MKTYILLVLFLLPLLHLTVVAQSSAVGWSTFSSGYAASTSATGNVRSVLGQTFVGSVSNSNTMLDNGFLAAPWVRGGVTTGVDERLPTSLPRAFRLEQNFPNPFNPSTMIRYEIRDAGFVNLTVYDVIGRNVATIVNELLPAGTHERLWDASNLPSGVYFYRLQASSTTDPHGSFVDIKKMLLIR